MGDPIFLPVVVCPYCNARAQLAKGIDIYPGRKDLADLVFWVCWPCDAYVGTHSNSSRFAPYGILANAELRRKRGYLHSIFDPTWDGPAAIFESRTAAYEWLAGVLNIPRDHCHIGMFDMPLCERAARVILAKRKLLRGDYD